MTDTTDWEADDESESLEGLENEVLVETARDSLAVYTGLVHRVVETGARAIPPTHILEHVIPVLEDDSLGNTVIIAPPGSAKTQTAIAYAGWAMGRNPNLHLGYISSTATQALRRSVAIRDTVETNQEYAAIFPWARPDKSKGWAEGEWYLQRDDPGDKDPTVLAQGVGGPLLGARLDLGLLDDIADPENMATAAQQEKIRSWLQDVFMTRFTPNGRAIMICTRWAERDPAAWAMERGWYVVHIPALDPAGASYWPGYWPRWRLACKDGKHGRYKINRGGVEQRFCWRVGQKFGMCKQRELGSQGFAQQFQGLVFDDESSILKRAYWSKRWRKLPDDFRTMKGGIFVDTAHIDNPHADWSVILIALTDGVRTWIVDIKRMRAEFPELLRAVKDVHAAWKLPIYIERTPGALPLIQQLSREVPGVRDWRIEGRSKMARVQATLPYVEAGDVLLPLDAPWVSDFVEECAGFPRAANDDQVDALTMALMLFYRSVARFGPA